MGWFTSISPNLYSCTPSLSNLTLRDLHLHLGACTAWFECPRISPHGARTHTLSVYHGSISPDDARAHLAIYPPPNKCDHCHTLNLRRKIPTSLVHLFCLNLYLKSFFGQHTGTSGQYPHLLVPLLTHYFHYSFESSSTCNHILHELVQIANHLHLPHWMN